MANLDIEAALRFLHVFFAVGWLGLIWFTAWVLPGIMGQTKPETRMDLQPKLGKRLVPLMAGASGGTILLGFIVYTLQGMRGDFADMPMGINAGVVVGLVMFGIATIIVLPAQKRVIRSSGAGNAPVPRDLARVVRWANINAWLGVLALFLMVMGSHAPLFI
ncbi:MAG: hypothetical protein KY455_04285 [Euryarchaeota archaeon]|nr:hypothetical protein [Euryarchaeota archaeon]